MELNTILLTFFLSIISGILGSILGLGGGIIIVPLLSLGLHVPIPIAMGAGLVSVIATSSGSAINYVKSKVTNIRISMLIEPICVIGAIFGSAINGLLSHKVLYMIFGLFLLYSGISMILKRNQEIPKDIEEHPIAKKLNLSGQYYDVAMGETIAYKVAAIYPAYGIIVIAAILGGLLGIGGGAFNVLGMNSLMKLPMKVSSATSSFLIGVTAVASASIYLLRGDIDPVVGGPVALGVLIGSIAGARIAQHLNSKTMKKIFIPILLYTALQMCWKGWWS